MEQAPPVLMIISWGNMPVLTQQVSSNPSTALLAGKDSSNEEHSTTEH